MKNKHIPKRDFSKPGRDQKPRNSCRKRGTGRTSRKFLNKPGIDPTPKRVYSKPGPDYMTEAEFCDRFGKVSRSSRRYRKAFNLKPVRYEKTIYFKRALINKIIAKSRIPANPNSPIQWND